MYKVLLLEDDLTLQDMIVEYFIDNNYYICYCSSDRAFVHDSSDYDPADCDSCCFDSYYSGSSVPAA